MVWRHFAGNGSRCSWRREARFITRLRYEGGGNAGGPSLQLNGTENNFENIEIALDPSGKSGL